MMLDVLKVYLVLSTFVCIGAEVYTSTYQVRQLAMVEPDLVVTLQAYIDAQETKLKALKQFLHEAKQNLTKSDHRQKSDVDDPISAFLLLKKFDATWSREISKLKDLSVITETFGRVNEIVPELPTTADVEGASRAVIRVQRTYGLTVRQLRNMSLASLSSSDCFQLAEAAFRHGLSNIAADWLREALYLKDPSPELAESREKMVKHLLIAAEKRFKGSQCRHTEGSHVYDPRHNDTKDARRQDVDSSAHVGCDELDGDALREEEMFSKLCRGDGSGPRSGTSLGACVYKRSKASYHRWKQEVLSTDPYIVLFHDVISDEEEQHLIDWSKNLLERSAVGQPDNSVILEARTSKVTWLWDNHTSVVNKLSRRVEDITGLCTLFREKGACAEPFQVLNYGIGGQYHSHFDFYQNRDVIKKTSPFVQDSGDRLATFMFYLSDVIAGGATVFPEVGVRITPVKGAAAFWYNFVNGQADLRTKHGGCPVLRGEKWANKWIHEIAKM